MARDLRAHLKPGAQGKGYGSSKGTAYKGSHGGKPPRKGGGCCPMAAAVRSAKRGQFRLARRYAVMSVRLIAAKAFA
jgi:hypothetical protein